MYSAPEKIEDYKMTDAHVVNDQHGVLAIGWLASAIENLKPDEQGTITLPTPPEWVTLWSQALAATRSSATMLDVFQGARYVSPSAPAPIPSPPTQEQTAAAMGAVAEEQERPESVMEIGDEEREAARKAGIPIEDLQAAGSQNVVTLIDCEHEGCTNKVPSNKSIPLCVQHEPQPDPDLEVGDE